MSSKNGSRGGRLRGDRVNFRRNHLSLDDFCVFVLVFDDGEELRMVEFWLWVISVELAIIIFLIVLWSKSFHKILSEIKSIVEDARQ